MTVRSAQTSRCALAVADRQRRVTRTRLPKAVVVSVAYSDEIGQLALVDVEPGVHLEIEAALFFAWMREEAEADGHRAQDREWVSNAPSNRSGSTVLRRLQLQRLSSGGEAWIQPARVGARGGPGRRRRPRTGMATEARTTIRIRSNGEERAVAFRICRC